MPLEAERKNKIYVRGAVTDSASPAQTQITVSAASNELILWPQVINSAKKLGAVALSYDPKDITGGDSKQQGQSFLLEQW